MRFSTSCPTCLYDETKRVNVKAVPQGGHYFTMPVSTVGAGEFGENQVAVCECGHGHRFIIITPPFEHFELLARSGIDAYVNGYFGETVMDLMAAVERAYEYFCQVVSYTSGQQPETFDAAWKALGKLSERRLGWFAATWFAETSTSFKVPNRITELRNESVHNGQLPSREQAAIIGDWTTSVIFDLCEKLRADHAESMIRRNAHNITLRRQTLLAKIKEDKNLRDLPEHSVSAFSIFGLNHGGPYPRLTFTQLVEQLGVPTLSGINPKAISPFGKVDFYPPKAATK